MKLKIVLGLLLIILGLSTVSLLIPPKTINSPVSQASPSPSPNPSPVPTNSPTINPSPKYHLIKTAFIPQAPERNWDQPWQDACEEASLLTVKYYYDSMWPSDSQIKSAILDMIDYEITLGWGNSINLDQMSQISKQYLNLQPTIIDNPSVSVIKSYLIQNIPIIVPASGKVLYRENKHFNSGGPTYHNLVIIGFDDSKQKFITHDVGTRMGSRYQYSYQLLLESIHDLPPSGLPGDILTGPKKVLILQKLL